jgi:hypothetical protein
VAKSFCESDTGPIRLAGGARIRHNAYVVDLVPVSGGDDSATRCGSEPVTISAWPVATIGVDASGRAVAEAKGPGMELSAYVFDTLHEDARSVLGRGRDRTRAGPRLMSHSSRREWPGYILTSIAACIALACHRAMGTQVS